MDDIYTLADLRRIETAAEVSGLDLMQKAARETADWIQRHTKRGDAVLCVVGVGNNGGDALWAAYYLFQAAYRIHIVMPMPPQSTATQSAFEVCRASGIPFTSDLPTPNQPFAWIIDGLFGIGLSRPLTLAWQQIVQKINALNVPILALDVPSGLDAWRGIVYEEAIRAKATLTFLCAKPGLYMAEGADHAGSVSVTGLGLPETLRPIPIGTLARASARPLLRSMNSHKGSYGTVCVVGGAKGMTGAALLASQAALMTGAGKVYAALLEPMVWDEANPELMLCDAKDLDWIVSDVMVIGPGLSLSPQAHQIFCQALKRPNQKVIDADALNLIARDEVLVQWMQENSQEKILTPHPAEAARLLHTTIAVIQQDRIKSAQALAEKFQATVVLKGCGTVIARPDGFFGINTTGNPALSGAGQGDVLAGFCGALLAQGLKPFDAASLAVYIHGLSADTWREEHQGMIGLTASQTILLLPDLLNRCIEQDVKA